MGLVAGLGSLAGGIAGLVGGSPAQNVQLPPPLPGIQQSGQNFLSTAGGIPQYNLYGGYIPQVQGVTQGLFNNPYAGGYQGGAGIAGGLGTAGALNQFGAGGNLYGAGTTALNTAMDPQSALYARTLQQVQDQSNVNNAMAGVATTPYGAGLTNMATANFNIDWQNQQLARQLAGLSRAQGAYGAASGLQSQAPINYIQGAGLPYSTFNTIGGNQIGALGTAGQFGQQAATIPEWLANAYSGYAQGGQGQALQGAQLGLQQAGQGFGQNLAYGGMIGGGLAALGNRGWGLPSGGGYGGTGWSPNYSGYTGWGGFTGGLGGSY